MRKSSTPCLLLVMGLLLFGTSAYGVRTRIDSPQQDREETGTEENVKSTSTILSARVAPRPDTDAYQIQSSDEIVIDMMGEDWGGSFKVPRNGNLNFRFIGTINVLGLTRDQLESEIRDRLQPDYYRDPQLQINFKSFAPIEVLVMGQVGKPQKVSLERAEGVMEAVLEAGSITKNSERTRIFVFRNDHGDTSAYFSNYERYVKGDLKQNMPLKGGDLVYIRTHYWPYFETLDQTLRTMGFATTISRDIRDLGD